MCADGPTAEGEGGMALRAEYTTVELRYGAGKAFEAALAVERSRLQRETLW